MTNSSILRAIPTGFFTWGFSIVDDEREVADLKMAWIGETGNFFYQGQRYELYRQGLLSGLFVIDAAGKIVAEADKPSPFFRTFNVDVGNQRFQLSALSPFTREFGVYSNDLQIGSIRPYHWFTRKAALDLPQDLELPVKVFLFWLVALMWRRAANNSAANNSN